MEKITQKKRIQFITCDRVKDTYGVTSGLFNSASFVVNYLNENDYEAKITPVVDSNSIDKIVTEFNPDVVVIEAIWVPPAKFKELFQIQRHKNRSCGFETRSGQRFENIKYFFGQIFTSDI